MFRRHSKWNYNHFMNRVTHRTSYLLSLIIIISVLSVHWTNEFWTNNFGLREIFRLIFVSFFISMINCQSQCEPEPNTVCFDYYLKPQDCKTNDFWDFTEINYISVHKNFPRSKNSESTFFPSNSYSDYEGNVSILILVPTEVVSRNPYFSRSS